MRVTLVCCLLLALALPARAQSEALPAAPVPVAPSGPGGPLVWQPPPPVAPVAPATPLFESPPTPSGPTLGDYYVSAEIAILFPTVQGHGTPTFSVPFQNLNTTISPTFELGYKLSDCRGYFIGTYRFLNADGTGTAVADDGTSFAVKSRLSVQSFGLDYGSAPEEIAPRYTFSWRLGARVDELFFDSRATNGPFTLQASNYFFGGGPHGRAELERRIGMLPGLSAFGRLDGAALVGFVQQRYRDEAAGLLITARHYRTIPVVQAQLGLSYAPPGLPNLKISSGYLFEEYFAVGTLGFGPSGSEVTSRGEAYWHGWFVRAQYDF
jgi:hypothetical protein